MAAHLDVQFIAAEPGKLQQIILEGEDVSNVIRTETVGAGASMVASLPAVREALLQRQRAFREAPGLIADGRDMGTVVFPDAPLKVFPRWEQWAVQVLQSFEDFQLLCAVRKGAWGVEGLNERVARVLHNAGLIDSQQPWYEGRPVLVTRNDYGLGLMNGDIGIALRLPDEHGEPLLRVAFPRNDGKGGVRFVLPSRLNEVETVFAMTVHKSQGSEFSHTALVLPDALNPVLTKELVYTGITRAKHCFSLIEPRQGIFEEAVLRKVRRISGLMLEQV